MKLLRLLSCGALWLCTRVLPVHAQSYHIGHTYKLPGDGGWDYLALDTVGHRLFIAHQDRVIVVDPETGKQLGEILGLNRAHGIAFAYEAEHGFATSGADSTVTMFDLKTLHVRRHTLVAPDDDAILHGAGEGESACCARRVGVRVPFPEQEFKRRQERGPLGTQNVP